MTFLDTVMRNSLITVSFFLLDQNGFLLVGCHTEFDLAILTCSTNINNSSKQTSYKDHSDYANLFKPSYTA